MARSTLLALLLLLVTTPARAEPLAALEGPGFVRLDIGGGEVAYASIPIGAREPRPVVLGVHGAADRADWSCVEWRAVVASWAFVVCPQGRPHPQWRDTYVFGSGKAVGMQAERAVVELRRRYGGHVADGPLVYGGWSWGATLAADVVTASPGRFDRVALVEVGHTPLDPEVVAGAFVRSGVRRTVVSCSSPGCRQFARGYAGAARRRALPAAFVDVGDRGHWFDEPVFRALAPKVAWMFEDERRYAGLVAAVDATWSTD